MDWHLPFKIDVYLYFMKNLLLLSSLFLFLTQLSAQTTGAFQQTVTFTETDYSVTRTLYYFVPADYDATEVYPLVVGFRGGPHSNAGQFRDQLAFLADSIGAIILCPENSAHFWNNEGETKQLFNYSVAHIITEYNINSDMIYLTGLSYGGRHAVIVAMDTDDGSIPALRGVIPFAAGSESDLQPNYAAISDFAPACICIGLNDSGNFINVSNNLHNDIQQNNGVSVLNEIPGVGHTVAFPAYPVEMMECIDFIEAQYEVSSTADPYLSQQLKSYPNPAQNSIQLDYPNEWSVQQIEMITATGQVFQPQWLSAKIIDSSQLANGAYFLRIVTEEGSAVQQIIVQH